MTLQRLTLNSWDRMLDLSLQSDAGRINRIEWLTDVLYPFLPIEELEQLSHRAPHEFLSPKILDHIANLEIRRHTQLIAAGSAGSALVGGGLTSTLGISADLVQYSLNLLGLVQKLAYLYGWDDFLYRGHVTEETRARITFLLGSLLGVLESDEVLRRAWRHFDRQVSTTPIAMEGKRSPVSLILREIAKRFLVLSLKGSATMWLTKHTPFLGAAIGAGSSYVIAKPAMIRLKVMLRDLMLDA